MKLGTSGVRRVVGTVAVAAATAAGVAMVNPATASAEVVPPVVSYKVTGNDLALTITNNNTGIAPLCQAFVVNAADSAAVLDNPLKLLDPNLVVYPKITDPSSLFAVGKGQTVTNTVTDVPDGTYAVLGACSDLLDLETLGKPVPGVPSLVVIGGPFSGINTGSLSDLFGSGSLEGLFG
ncbi:hypothetical protein [Rhodococcus sp. C1]|uniref:hypothetical protein n=1 Tax=Rhodococcus sp. C1 TaxID=644410 RepID=UPI000A5ADD71|nr:hypothetical protein [Rhodococcus sp. C1]